MFEFTIPTESAPQSPRSLVASVAVHGLAILLLFAIRFSVVSKIPVAPEHLTLLAPARETPIVPPKVHAPRPREFRPTPPVAAHLTIPLVIPAPPVETPKPVMPETPRPAPPVVVSIPVIAKPTPPAAKPVVRAAGFESSDNSATGPVRGTVSAVGSFESANAAEGAKARSQVTRPGGFSDVSNAVSSSGARRNVASAAFGDTTIEKNTAPRQAALTVRLTPVEIISKPKPAYTDDARAKNIEGEVLLDVQFSASGEVRVLRVVRGLGHGLDETALSAALGIRFQPATRDGAAVDSTALVHIVFQLAN